MRARNEPEEKLTNWAEPKRPQSWAVTRLPRRSAAISRGAKVRVRWAEETRGHITDIACFELESGD